MLTCLQHERFIRHILRKLARQRVAMVLQPGNIWVVEKAVEDTPEPLENAIPKGNLTPDGRLPEKLFQGVGPIYKLTSAGWSVIYRSNQLALVALLISAMSLLIGVSASGASC